MRRMRRRPPTPPRANQRSGSSNNSNRNSIRNDSSNNSRSRRKRRRWFDPNTDATGRFIVSIFRSDMRQAGRDIVDIIGEILDKR